MINEMAKVQDCSALDCAHNQTWKCLAPVISVGKQGIPTCDTFDPTGTVESAAVPGQGVGACDIYSCLRNRDLNCIAYSIKVRFEEGSPRCKSYKNRYK